MSFIRQIGEGELGGKARSLSFLCDILKKENLYERFAPHHILIPKTTVLGSREFVRFVADNKLEGMHRALTDDRVVRRFLDAEFDNSVKELLCNYVLEVTTPIAVRSSAMNEDGENHPLAGMFATLLIPNSHPDPNVRFNQLQQAVKIVYSSVFFKEPLTQKKKTGQVIGDEEMAVILQEVVGKKYDHYFYPNISGVAQSNNFFPFGPMKREDGVGIIAFGLGTTVVSGEGGYRFSPKHPNISPDFYTSQDVLQNTQRDFLAIDLRKGGEQLQGDELQTLTRVKIDNALEHGTLDLAGSMVDLQNDIVFDSLFGDGKLAITFNNLLKKGKVPFAKILQETLSILKVYFSSDVDMEFAVNVNKDSKQYTLDFYLLQARTLVFGKGTGVVDIPKCEKERIVLESRLAAGNGIIKDVKYIVYVPSDTVEPENVIDQAQAIAYFNSKLHAEKMRYILIGPGRWGSTHPMQGIPVKYNHISDACALVEIHTGRGVAPSQGSHFFHNLTSDNLFYLAVMPKDTNNLPGILDKFSLVEEKNGVKLLESCMDIYSDGRSSYSLIVFSFDRNA